MLSLRHGERRFDPLGLRPESRPRRSDPARAIDLVDGDVARPVDAVPITETPHLPAQRGEIAATQQFQLPEQPGPFEMVAGLCDEPCLIRDWNPIRIEV